MKNDDIINEFLAKSIEFKADLSKLGVNAIELEKAEKIIQLLEQKTYNVLIVGEEQTGKTAFLDKLNYQSENCRNEINMYSKNVNFTEMTINAKNLNEIKTYSNASMAIFVVKSHESLSKTGKEAFVNLLANKNIKNVFILATQIDKLNQEQVSEIIQYTKQTIVRECSVLVSKNYPNKESEIARKADLILKNIEIFSISSKYVEDFFENGDEEILRKSRLFETRSGVFAILQENQEVYIIQQAVNWFIDLDVGFLKITNLVKDKVQNEINQIDEKTVLFNSYLRKKNELINKIFLEENSNKIIDVLYFDGLEKFIMKHYIKELSSLKKCEDYYILEAVKMATARCKSRLPIYCNVEILDFKRLNTVFNEVTKDFFDLRNDLYVASVKELIDNNLLNVQTKEYRNLFFEKLEVLPKPMMVLTGEFLPIQNDLKNIRVIAYIRSAVDKKIKDYQRMVMQYLDIIVKVYVQECGDVESTNVLKIQTKLNEIKKDKEGELKKISEKFKDFEKKIRENSIKANGISINSSKISRKYHSLYFMH